MSVATTVLIIVGLAVVGYFVGRLRASSVASGNLAELHSRPTYYGSFVLIWVTLPSIAVLVAWLVVSPIIVDNQVLSSLPASVQEMSSADQSLQISKLNSIATGMKRLDADDMKRFEDGAATLRELLAERGVAVAGEVDDYMPAAAEKLNGMTASSQLYRTVIVLLLAIAGFIYAWMLIGPKMRARNRVERVVLGALIVASSIAILTTVGIVWSMVSETGRFFSSVPPLEFFFGTVWDPRFAAAGAEDSAGQFGLIPLLAGTLYIALVAMAVAVPIGLFAAVYMSEYASNRMRATVKPLLEVLAGIPTIVYGFFALVTVGPFLRDISAQINGIATGNIVSFIQAQSVLTAGVVMGIMLIPFVSSLSDDIITAVPRSLRDGSLGLGATRSETVKRVIFPAAIPGIVGALLLTASRAIGETMIVVLAAGVAARLSINPFEPMTTVTVKIVNQLTGDLEFTSPQTLVAFALGITLFVITLGLNFYALYIVRKYREQYE
ncbi:phosphate ABC transporter permease subunit PstC [Hoeflea prorocentri]|uniref:Phosphate transport system permease protein n=1 Tax=Hoeflea prorocentri TaxID=1922333 RepID=A0A9X3UL59_9HYPH|nr:phosphate ABC transporter permease subunit PstC [Hoeflea prorocentri]MCY6382582.1 phosphate ABC transporter permease subunit PstC [Hoeflea prorocentri]MDA5400382.1 phosphate ABC transporter permease subunit PstC [Hoeflea prorocentri]